MVCYAHGWLVGFPRILDSVSSYESPCLVYQWYHHTQGCTKVHHLPSQYTKKKDGQGIQIASAVCYTHTHTHTHTQPFLIEGVSNDTEGPAGILDVACCPMLPTHLLSAMFPWMLVDFGDAMLAQQPQYDSRGACMHSQVFLRHHCECHMR